MLVALTLLLAGFGLSAPVADAGVDLGGRGDHAGSGAAYVWVTVARPMNARRPTRMSAAVELPPEPRRIRAPVPPAHRRQPAAGTAPRRRRAASASRWWSALLVVVWLVLQLFASVLAPFVAAAVIAYALDPPTTRPDPARRAARRSRRC